MQLLYDLYCILRCYRMACAWHSVLQIIAFISTIAFAIPDSHTTTLEVKVVGKMRITTAFMASVTAFEDAQSVLKPPMGNNVGFELMQRLPYLQVCYIGPKCEREKKRSVSVAVHKTTRLLHLRFMYSSCISIPALRSRPVNTMCISELQNRFELLCVAQK